MGITKIMKNITKMQIAIIWAVLTMIILLSIPYLPVLEKSYEQNVIIQLTFFAFGVISLIGVSIFIYKNKIGDQNDRKHKRHL
ncbi:hypothetical protein QLY34_004681 [Salmonella enterica subsp. enterica serovar Infantis]|nr:hypothetical protein [Salmonella enterica subsp. enterica serovar Infantis]EIC7575150.1 hypothetical protein [Salmonella enterica]EDY8650605.1 hypothetical protein [Salmonella enterica subsp. enterica serovar Infantis]EGT2917305.1 hypothetical protein [Salmonella enterica subsp. enterica serovar Infantis]EGX7525282.1 hypothetical protein [Salmonella enterica subsp. enterica serovar Infantis]